MRLKCCKSAGLSGFLYYFWMTYVLIRSQLSMVAVLARKSHEALTKNGLLWKISVA